MQLGGNFTKGSIGYDTRGATRYKSAGGADPTPTKISWIVGYKQMDRLNYSCKKNITMWLP